MDLFLDHKLPSFEKVAAEIKLPEDPNRWPQEILQELHKQVSFISDFDPKVEMDRVDAEKGYGFGHFNIGHRMSIPGGAQQPDVKSVRVPIIIEEGRLKPFDLLVSEESKVWPLTENRLRRAMFRPSTFDMAAKSPGTSSLIDRLYPPSRDGSTIGGGGMVTHSSVGMGKMGMAKTAEEAFEDGVLSSGSSQGESKDPHFEAWDGQTLNTAGIADQRRRTRAEGTLQEGAGLGEGAWAKVLSPQNKQTMGYPMQTDQSGVYGQGAAAHAQRTQRLHSIAGGTKQAAARKLKTPEPEKIITGQKAEGYKPQYTGVMRADGSIAKRASDLSAQGRDQVKKDNFAIPAPKGEEGKGGGKGDYPIHDIQHARAALSMVAAHGSEQEKEKVVRAVAAKYPELAKRSETIKKAGILSQVVPTVGEGRFLSFSSACEPEAVKVALLKNSAALEAVSKLAEWTPGGNVSLLDLTKSDVVQVATVGDGTYRIKHASSKYWLPQEAVVDRGAVYQAIGDSIRDLDASGSITMAKGASVDGDDVAEEQPVPIEEFGMYKVETADGKKVVGFAIPNLYDLDGTSVPLVLFTNGAASALQADMVGVPIGSAPVLPDGPVAGHGSFVHTGETGKVVSTVPMEIKGEAVMEGEALWMAETFTGEPVSIKKQPNISKPMKVDGTVVIPDSWRWLPLGGEALALVDLPEAFSKKAQLVRQVLSVDIRGSEGVFSLDGPAIEKVASEQKSFVGIDDAAFLLAGCGVDPNYAMHKLGEASYLGAPIRVRVGRIIKTAESRMTEALKTASTHNLPLFQIDHMVKEASVIPDPTAVDTVLSLGFLTPENVSIFIDALPKIEESQSRMCELLLASRLGLKEVPETALERAIRLTEEVIDGLKVLTFQES